MKNLSSMNILKSSSTLILFLLFSQCFGQSNESWKQKLDAELVSFKECMTNSNDSNCKTIIGKALQIVFDSNEFLNDKSSQYSSPISIASSIESNQTWKKMGNAYDQEVLKQGQALANKNQPVVAIYKNEEGENSHIVLILPGELTRSGSWGMLVPNAASFFTHDPQKSFVDKSLAYAFTKQMLLRVELYAKEI